MHRETTEPTTLTREGQFQVSPCVGEFREVTRDLAGMRHLIVNVFFIGEPGSADWTLVDAGLGGAASAILRAAEKRFGPNARPKNILLTHGDGVHPPHVVAAVRPSG